MTTSSDVIDRQVAAYNRRDIQGFVACYAPDAKVVQPDGSTLASGRDQIGSVYGGPFETVRPCTQRFAIASTWDPWSSTRRSSRLRSSRYADRASRGCRVSRGERPNPVCATRGLSARASGRARQADKVNPGPPRAPADRSGQAPGKNVR